ncbi:MAG TPA: dihydrodipicolinate synthase family protein [Polyangia bacterium]|jgi:dihydrodipicolinate synthase/N-acetylneuraminate lyase|nr:dihydrodipicolinate synthase family protein [Polyangia bacterium]
MKTQAVTFADLSASVLAVPPLARNADLTLNKTANGALIRHIEEGGISTLLYGGNANLYHISVGEYGALLDQLAELAAPNTWVIPSVGPDFGKMMDQAELLRSRAFPTAMVLPATFPNTVAGAEAGLRRFARAFGKPIIVYIKAEGYLTPQAVKRLVDDGLVAGIKYAIVRADPRQDAFLSELVELVDRRTIISGIGERPAIVHLRDFGLNGFTTGSGCVGPRGSAGLLAALKRKDYARAEELRAAFIPLEDLRDAHSPIRVLHEAVRLAEIANTGPILPLLSNLDTEHHAAVKKAAQELLATDRTLLQAR